LESFSSIFYKSLKLNCKLPRKETVNNKDRIEKLFHFEKFKKKRNISSLTSKDKIVKAIRYKNEKNNKFWMTKKIYQAFNFHTLCISFKNFYPQKVNFSGNNSYLFSVFRSSKTNFQSFRSSDNCITISNNNELFAKFNVNKNYNFSKETLTLAQYNPDVKRLGLNFNARKEIKFVFLNALKGTANRCKYSNFEIFNFVKSFSSTKTKDWKSSISFINRFKHFKNSKLLNLFGLALEFGREVPKSMVESRKFHSKSAKIGNSNSLLDLATYFMKGIGVKKCKQSAFLIFSKAAHQGFFRGIYTIVAMLNNGIGVQKDPLRALKILENSRNLMSKERKPFKKNRKVNKNGYFKPLFSSIRNPCENSVINFLLQSFSSPLTSYLGTLIFERTNLVASDINFTNISDKKGSFVCRKKLKNLFLENRQQYLFQETSRGSWTPAQNELSECALKWKMGLCNVKDSILFRNLSRNEVHNKNIFNYFKILENLFSVFIHRTIFFFFSICIHLINFFLVIPVNFSFILLKLFHIFKS